MSNKIKVLIVDDEANARTILNDVLSEYGFDILEADSGEAALELAGQQKIDVVLLDTVLPGINGHETCRRLKALNSKIKIITTTGKIDAVDVREAVQAGSDDYVVKTSGFDELLKSIARLTGVVIHTESE